MVVRPPSDTADAEIDPRVSRTRHDVLTAAIQLLIDEGWDAVTQTNVARAAGYSKATVYSHWPDRFSLLRDAFARYGEMPHHELTGDLRVDLIGELHSFRRAMVDHRLDRVLAILAERSLADPQFIEVRDRFVADGERPIRRALSTVIAGDELDAATLMLCGMVLHGVLMQGSAPTDAQIETAVDRVLAGFGLDDPAPQRHRDNTSRHR